MRIQRRCCALSFTAHVSSDGSGTTESSADGGLGSLIVAGVVAPEFGQSACGTGVAMVAGTAAFATSPVVAGKVASVTRVSSMVAGTVACVGWTAQGVQNNSRNC